MEYNAECVYIYIWYIDVILHYIYIYIICSS